MSRLAKRPIQIPEKTEITVNDREVFVRGPLGEQKRSFDSLIEIGIVNGGVVLTPQRTDKFARALSGTYAAHIKNMIVGVNKGFEKKLIIEGIGYKASISGSDLTLNMGFSHPVKISIPGGIEMKVEKNEMLVKGIDKELVGQFTARIRKVKEPEPYKGKGIKYDKEIIRRKQGKKATG